MVTIADLAAHFGLKTLVGSTRALNRPITAMETDRPGVEIMGFFQNHEYTRISLIGNKEMSIIESLDSDTLYRNFKKLCDPRCPGIIVCQGLACPEPLLQAAKEMDEPLFSYQGGTSQLSYDILDFLSYGLAPKTQLHAVLMEIYGEGVLIMGDSGIGKSEIALDLIKRGHLLIADDMVDISLVRGNLIGRCPEVLQGMLEVRGIGVIDVARMFGINSMKSSTTVDFAVKLIPFDRNQPLERLGVRNDHIEIMKVKRPMVELPVSAARSMAQIIETAVTNAKLKNYGYDSAYEFQKRFVELANKNREGK